MKCDQWLEILSTINADSDLNGNNVIEKIKEKLEKENQSTYQEWEGNQFNINHRLSGSFTLLHIAAMNGLAKVAELLIKKGADNVVDQHGLTPLHWAFYNNRPKIVEVLVKNKTDFNTVYKNGWTLLHWAAKEGHIEVVRALIDRNADINEVDKKGYKCTPLHWAAKEGHTEIVDILIKNNADFNVVDQCGQTPLYYAAKEGHAEVVRAIMNKGADPLFGNRDVRILKRLIESIESDNLKHLEKAGEIQQSKELIDDKYEFLKYSLLLRENRPLIDVIGKDTFNSLYAHGLLMCLV